MTGAFFKKKSISLCPVLFCISRPNLPVIPGVSWLPTIGDLILVNYNEKDIFFWVFILEGLVGLHRTIQVQLLEHYLLGHRLGLS